MTLYYFYFLVLGLAFLIGILKFSVLNKSSKTMLLLLPITIVSELCAAYFSHKESNNFFVYHIFLPIEASILAFCYYKEVKEKWIVILSAILILFSFFNSFFIQNYKAEFCSYTFILNCILSTLFGIRYLKLMLDQPEKTSFQHYPLFWISIGFMTFNIINLFILGTHNAIAEKILNIGAIFRNVRFFTNYLLYILLGIAFLSKQESLGKAKE